MFYRQGTPLTETGLPASFVQIFAGRQFHTFFTLWPADVFSFYNTTAN